MPTRTLPLLLAIALAGCEGIDTDAEGTEPFECRDGADNDQDGYFDCQDSGCWNSPDCGGPGAPYDTGDTGSSDTDAGTDADTTGTDTEPAIDPSCTEPICDFTEVTVSYRIDWTPWDSMAELGYAPCYTTWTGEGTIVAGTTDHVTFDGTWALTDTDCGQSMYDLASQAIWVDESGEAHHTFYFGEGSTRLDDWFAHKHLDGHSTSSQDRYYVTEVYATLDPTVAAPSTTWELEESRGDLWMDLSHQLDVTWAKDAR